MSSYGMNVTFTGWRDPAEVTAVLTQILGRDVALPELQEDDQDVTLRRAYEAYDDDEEEDDEEWVTPLMKLAEALEAANASQPGRPALRLGTESQGLDEPMVVLLRVVTPLYIENGSDGPRDLGAKSIPLADLKAGLDGIARFEAATGLRPHILHLGNDDPK